MISYTYIKLGHPHAMHAYAPPNNIIMCEHTVEKLQNTCTFMHYYSYTLHRATIQSKT